MRIDGILFDAHSVPKKMHGEIVSRIKVMGRMDIAEKRIAQDGRASAQMGDRQIDLRISVIPTSFGERIVIRLLDKSARMYRLEELGMNENQLKTFRKLIGLEHGLILVTGPTGSGKSTTLYASLQEINSVEKNILTLEDPIEYKLEGISQTQVNEKKGMTFAKGLRNVLRQDPDIIMVGEIRDHETAVMAIQSALTGHMVFSTLHTNDAPSAIARLLDLGIEPYLVASSLVGVLAQRLVRRICVNCSKPYSPQPDELKKINLTEIREKDTYRYGTGCQHCRETGYQGRVGMFELLIVSDEIQKHIQKHEAASTIRSTAVQSGMKTLRDEGILKVCKGTTTIDEVFRVTMLSMETLEQE
jgi:type II secretory ATPase GspE/PulE/Tfp pilus assembly ATPase PilB-like protein